MSVRVSPKFAFEFAESAMQTDVFNSTVMRSIPHPTGESHLIPVQPNPTYSSTVFLSSHVAL